MPLYDQHVHSNHSMDSTAAPIACVAAAIARGLDGITFTEHFDTHPDDWDKCVYDDRAYSASIRRLRQKYGTCIFIGKGIEVCFQPDRLDFILSFLADHEFDLVVLSVHYFGSLALCRRENWSEVGAAEGTRQYLETVLEAAHCCEKLHKEHGRVFDVLGHLDLVKRYTTRFLGTFDLSPFGELIDEILRTCLTADLTPETNTSTMRQDVGEPAPAPAVAARYARLGGTAMSLGSDAHQSKDVGSDFGRAVAMLRGAGLRRSAIFKQRHRVDVPLD